MPRKCSVCVHPERAEIEAAIVGQIAYRDIARQWGVSKDAVGRHRKAHLPANLVRATETAQAIDLREQIESLFGRIHLLYDACDRWLRDPEDPSRYDIGPRAGDISVTYWEEGPSGRRVKRKRKLSALLAEAMSHNGRGRTIELVETKHADPRELVLKTAARLQAQVELLAKLLGELQQEGTVNITLSAEWIELRTVVLRALAPFPDARLAVYHALGDGHGH